VASASRAAALPMSSSTASAVYEVSCQAPSGVFLTSSWAARTVHAYGLLPLRAHLPGPLRPSIFSPPPPSPHPRLGEGGGGEKMLFLDLRLRCGAAALSLRRSASLAAQARRPGDRLSVWDPLRSQAPVTVYACRRAARRNTSPPIERTVLCRFTRRHNGGSSRQLLA
jgi:hypothetical protein